MPAKSTIITIPYLIVELLKTVKQESLSREIPAGHPKKTGEKNFTTKIN
jgi:hypothetical protein